MENSLLMSLIPATGVVLLIIGFYKTWFEKQVQAQEHIQDLLGNVSNRNRPAKDQDNILKRRKKNKDGTASKREQLEIKLERANMLITPNEFYMISIGSALLGGLVIWFLSGQNMLITIPLGAACIALPYAFMSLKTMLRMKKAAAQFSDVLNSMVNAFKTGFGFSRAVQMVADNYDDPWGTEFGKMAAEMNLGASMEDALYSLSSRVPSPDVDLFVTALLIQKETGGSLAELLGNLSHTIRDRYKLFQKVGAISAQGKLSAGIVCCVPFLLCGIMYLFLPDAMIQFVTNPIGIALLILAGFWMCCGVGVLYKIVQIEV
ncbi:type II secretion system F family protein [Vampirovibrio sp.]|uniref:type II secretion system F family protein n=1 Tax=Vampirovibrio sp. TaxID=2717857 RepID=UPI0035945486